MIRYLIIVFPFLFSCEPSSKYLDKIELECHVDNWKTIELERISSTTAALMFVDDLMKPEFNGFEISVPHFIDYIEPERFVMCSYGLPIKYFMIDTCGNMVANLIIEYGRQDLKYYYDLCGKFQSMFDEKVSGLEQKDFFEKWNKDVNGRLRKKWSKIDTVQILPVTLIENDDKVFYGSGIERICRDETKKLDYSVYSLYDKAMIGISWNQKEFVDLKSELELSCLLSSIEFIPYE